VGVNGDGCALWMAVDEEACPTPAEPQAANSTTNALTRHEQARKSSERLC
jgi:hypothetical protein